MPVLFVLIPISLAMATFFVIACIYAIQKGQFEDLESPRWKVLFEHSPQTKQSNTFLKQPTQETHDTNSI